MKIVTVRRTCQVFFLVLFVWLCVVSSSGQAWWQKRGWPVNWLLQLDPLVAVGTALAAGTLAVGLLWALVVFVLTVLFGRVFCGWLCPFGTIHQAVGWLARRRRPVPEQIEANRYRPWQALKYYLLAFLLASAAGGLLTDLVRQTHARPFWLAIGAAAVLVFAAMLAVLPAVQRERYLG